MKRVINLILFLFLQLSFYAQTQLVLLEDLSYHSSFEEWAIRNHFLNNNISEFLLYSAADKLFTENEAKKHENDFNALLESMELDVKRLKKPKNKTNHIFEIIHNKYLKRYRPSVGFHAIFQKGEYNCLTASCLYAIAFNKLNIPYEIVVAPGHVYLIAYPDEYDLIVETTNPVNGVYKFDEKQFKKYKDRLLTYKLITDEEYDVLTLKDFQYRQDSTVNNYSLTSYLYSNQLFEEPKPNREGKFRISQKVYIFNPLELHKENLETYAFSYCLDDEYSLNQYKTVLMYSRLSDTVLVSEAKVNFSQLSDNAYESKAKFEGFKEIYLKLKATWPDSCLYPIDSISAPFFKLKGYHLEQNQEYRKAHEAFVELYKIEKKDKYISWLTYNLSKSYHELGVLYYDVKQLKEKFPEFLSNEHFAHQYYYALVNMSAYYLTIRDVKSAVETRNEFESTYSKNIPELKESISQVYVVIASYYFRKGNDKEARKAIEKGLEYVPYDMKLIKLKMALE